MDVIVYNRYKIHGYEYILNVIDTNSRYVASRALTNMKLKEESRGNKAVTLLDAVKDVMKELGYPKELRCDNQFISDEFKKLMSENNVKVVYSEVDNVIKNSLVESFNKTLAGLLQKWRISTRKKEWYKVLPLLIKKYNNNVHSRIKAKPIDVWTNKDTNHQKIFSAEVTFRVGDKIRIVTNKKVFGKGDEIRNSKIMYLIVEEVTNKFRIKNLETKEILKRLYNPRSMLKVTDLDEINEVIEPVVEQKFIGATPVRSRKKK
jgi:hypothetical protein